MNVREITIGRANDCDIFLDSRCQYASSHHGVIYFDGNQLMFRDTSTNGTMINNISVKKRAIPINRGDMIMLAGKYPLTWNQIDMFFPPHNSQHTIISQPVSTQSYPNQQPATGYNTQSDRLQKTISGWNWGAFVLYPIWGFFNGCWWAFLIWFFFGFTIIPAIVFGICGSKWAWENKTWASEQDFISTQSSWATWGIIIFCINMFFAFIGIFFFSSMIAALFSMM